MSREYVSTEFNCRRISVIDHRPQRERKSVWQIVSNERFVNDRLLSGKLSKCLYTLHSYTHLFTSSALWSVSFGPFKTTAPQNVTDKK